MLTRLLSCIVLVAPGRAFVTTGGLLGPDPVFVTEQQRHSVLLYVSTRAGDAPGDKAKWWSKGSSKSTPTSSFSPPSPSSSSPSLSLDADAIASAAGGAMLGAGIGIIAAMSQPELADLDPALSAAVVGCAALATATQDNDQGRLVTKLLGKPTQALGRFLVDQFKSVLDSATKTITAIPNRIASAVQRQINQAKDEITALPERFVNLLRRKADDAVAEIQSIPQKLSDAAARAAEDLMEDIRRTAEEASNEAKMLPQRLSVAAKKKADETAQDALLLLEGVVEEAKALPSRKKDELLAFFNVDAGAKASKHTPQPPKIPPAALDV